MGAMPLFLRMVLSGTGSVGLVVEVSVELVVGGSVDLSVEGSVELVVRGSVDLSVERSMGLQ
jgi:hypothetical protein